MLETILPLVWPVAFTYAWPNYLYSVAPLKMFPPYIGEGSTKKEAAAKYDFLECWLNRRLVKVLVVPRIYLKSVQKNLVKKFDLTMDDLEYKYKDFLADKVEQEIKQKLGNVKFKFNEFKKRYLQKETESILDYIENRKNKLRLKRIAGLGLPSEEHASINRKIREYNALAERLGVSEDIEKIWHDRGLMYNL